MVKFLIKRPIAVVMSFIAITMLGIVASFELPISLMPDIDIPEITVQVTKANTSVREMENTVVKRLRRQLLQVPNLDDIQSETRDGNGILHLKFKYGTNNTVSFMEVNEKIDEAMRNLPREMERPRVIKASATDIPVFFLNASLKSEVKGSEAVAKFMEFSEFCDAVIKKRIEQRPEVAMVDVTGNLYSELYISPDTEKLKTLGIHQETIQNVLKNNNITYGNIMVHEGKYRYSIRFSSFLRTVEDVKNIYIKANQRILQLKDIAEIGLRPRQATGSYLHNNENAIGMAIIKQSAARMSDLKKEINYLIDRFEDEYPEIEFEISQDQTGILEYTISNLKQSLLWGGSLAFFIMFFFLKDIKSPLLIGFSIPTAVIISLLFFHLIGLSINIISLSGLILGVGMMIDNSIIVIDTIGQHIERGSSLFKACADGTSEVIRPLLSSVFSTCAVFLPLIFISGISGALFYDQAAAITIGLVTSLLVSITLLPVLYKLFYHKENFKKTKTKIFLTKISLFDSETAYTKGFDFVFKYKKLMPFLFLFLVLVSFVLFQVVPKEKLPRINQTEIMLNIDWNENIHVDENQKRVTQLLTHLKENLIQSNSYIAEQQFLLNREQELSYSESRIYLKAASVKQLLTLKKKIASIFKSKFNNATYEFSPYKTLFDRLFSDDQPELLAKVTSKRKKEIPDINKIQNLQKKLNTSIVNITTKSISLQEHIVIHLLSENMMLYDVSRNSVFEKLKASFNVLLIDQLKSRQQYIPIVISDKTNTISEIMSTLLVTNNKGIEIPIAALTSIEKTNSYKTLLASKEGEYAPIVFEFEKNKNINIKSLTDNLSQLIKKDDNLEVRFTGKVFTGQKLFKEMSFVLIISILLLYFILAAQFESLTQPFIVLLEIPIDIAGALFMLYLFNGSLNLMSMIGIIVMSGIIINDSILKIDTINQLRKNGMQLMDAIKLAGHRRLKPIIMTSLTTILALIPFLFSSDLGSELQKPLALTVIGGMLLGTLVSLYFIPLCYYYLYKNQKNKTTATK